MVNNFARQTAYKTWISNLYHGKLIKSEEEFKPDYIAIDGMNMSRVNLVANVIDKYEKEGGGYVSLIVDDGSAQIRIKSWNEDCKILKHIKKGDIILIIGKIKEDKMTDGEVYITAEIIKNVEPNYEVLRKLELLKGIGKPKQYSKQEPFLKEEKAEEIEEIKISSNKARQIILNLIEKNESLDFDGLLKECSCSENRLTNELNELLKDGEIFEVKGRYNLLR